MKLTMPAKPREFDIIYHAYDLRYNVIILIMQPYRYISCLLLSTLSDLVAQKSGKVRLVP